MSAVSVGLNRKQYEFLQKVVNNRADFVQTDESHPQFGEKYQDGFRACFQASRGAGKTRVLLTLIGISVRELPRALAALGAKTFKQVEDVILSQSHEVWDELGMIEYDTRYKNFGHYVVNKKPPAHWPRPYKGPRSYENTVTFWTGYTLIMFSADRPETMRGLSVDQLFLDESGSVNDNFQKVLKPAIRANKGRYRDRRVGREGFNHPLHWLYVDLTSAPWLPDGKWIYKTRENMAANPERFYYLESTAYDNLEFLPGNYIESQRESLSPLAFDVEILNIAYNKIEGGFYSSFDIAKHTYSNKLSYKWNPSALRNDVSTTDYDPKLPIEVSFDFNSKFTSMIVAQDHKDELRFINVFYVKDSDTTILSKLLSNFFEIYGGHKFKEVNVYGDASGKTIPPNVTRSLYNDIRKSFKGWVYHEKVTSYNKRYLFRYNVINSILSEMKPQLPKIRINKDTCKSLIISIESAPIDAKYEKDKRTETRKNFPQEFATHLSDAFDYIVYEKYNKKISLQNSRSTPMKVM